MVFSFICDLNLNNPTMFLSLQNVDVYATDALISSYGARKPFQEDNSYNSIINSAKSNLLDGALITSKNDKNK